MIQKPAPTPLRAAEAPKAQKDDIRERVVKRHVAVCPYGEACEQKFNDRKPRATHLTADGAEVEAARHIREAHKADLTTSIGVLRRAKVQREIVSEEIIEG